MKTEYFIAKRMFLGQKHGQTFSRPIVRIAIAGIALGVSVMIIAVAIVTGFKNEISNKVIGFGSHIRIVNYDSNNSYETHPISTDQTWIESVKLLQGVRHVQQYSTKAGILKTDYYLQGIVLKGVDSDFDFSFFSNYLVEGNLPNISDTAKSNDVLISKYLADILNLKINDKIACYFIQEPPRMRKFTICGIYDTQLQDLDELFVLVDAQHVKKLNDWNSNQCSGFEILIDDLKNLDKIAGEIRTIISYTQDTEGNFLKVKTIKDDYPEIFNWLKLLDMNVWVILILITCVAGFNMISGLLVIILERVNMIGILKSIGCQNFNIRKVFLFYATMLISRGVLWGNILGLLLCFIQWKFQIVSLNAASYYVSYVPINFNILYILLLNFGSLFITFLMMIIPSALITRISPSETIRFN